MQFNPVKVSFNGFAILFKTLSAHCVLLYFQETLLELTRRIKRQYGVYIELPAPHQSSNRFRPCAVCKEHVSLTQNSISCETCDVLYHVKCTDISLEDMENDSEAYLGWWTCQNCSGVR